MQYYHGSTNLLMYQDMIFFDNQTNNTSCVAGMNGPTVVYTPDGVTRALFEVGNTKPGQILEALCMRWTYTPVVGSTPVLGFLPWSWCHPFRGSVTVQINRQ